MTYDIDLQSIQEARQLCQHAHETQQQLKNFTQEQIDTIVKAMCDAGVRENRRLAQMAVDETGYGNVEDKMVKNELATAVLYNFVKDLKTVGVIKEYPEKKVMEIAEPMGVVAAIIPSTNPTSTTMYKAIISIKSRNAVVVSPHPKAKKCIAEAARVMAEAGERAGLPQGAISCLTIPTLEGTEELMRHKRIGVILATGGSGMVKAAYSSGKPAFGVGPGNVPAFIERTADVPKAVRDILAGKTFDYGTICASEQAIIAEAPIAAQVENELVKQGGYFMTEAEIAAVSRIAVLAGNAINPAIVGKSPHVIAQMAGITIPPNTRALIARLKGVGRDYPLSMEKLSPILAYYVESDWETGCHRAIEILNYGGIGHTLAIHSRNKEVIMEFALKKPVFRIVVNTPATHGAVGATTGLDPALTLGCGTWGGSITSDNITPMHLLNIKRLAYGIREVGEPMLSAKSAACATNSDNSPCGSHVDEPALHRFSPTDIEKIVLDLLEQRKTWNRPAK